MRVDWYGQAAFHLRGRDASLFIDPIGDTSGLASRGIQFDYAPASGVSADLVLVTHEHADHNGVETIGGDPAVLRSTAGRLQSPLGEVVAIASEHDEAAGTQRGPNTIFVFELDGLRVCHFGDFGQRILRDEQWQAIGPLDLLFIPVGGGPTIGAEQALQVVRRLSVRWVVPMHYRTPRVSFLDTADEFLAGMQSVQQIPSPAFDTDALDAGQAPAAVVPQAP
jgi:L-ascorbate metabolism protein UlaG (beta-lactamase superfamily)